MSVSYRTHAKSDTFVSEAFPDKNFGSLGVLRVDSDTGHHKRALIHIPPPAHFKKDYVIKAKLTLHTKGDLSGVTLTATRITATWHENKVTWNSKPTTDTTHQATATVAGDGSHFDFDITDMMNDVTTGAHYYGIQVTSDSSTSHAIYSSEADRSLQPELFIKYAHRPDPPVKLTPNGLQSYDPLPRVGWHLPKTDKGIEQTYSRVQIFVPDGMGHVDTSSPSYDSGKWANTEHHFLLDTDTTGAPSALNTPYVGVTAGQGIAWRVMIWDDSAGGGVPSDWSDLATFSYNTAGTIGITAPVDMGDVVDTTPDIVWTWTPGSNGNAPSHVRYQLVQIDSEDNPVLPLLQDTGWDKFDGTFSFTPDKNKITHRGVEYQVTVLVNDGVDSFGNQRNTSDGETPTAAIHFFLIHTETIWPPYNVEADSYGPGFRLEWDNDLQDVPDWWIISVDDENVTENIQGDDPFVEFYEHPDWTGEFEVDSDLDGFGDGLTQYGSLASHSVVPGTPPVFEDIHGTRFHTTSGTDAGVVSDAVPVSDHNQMITVTTSLWVDSLTLGCSLTQYLKFYDSGGTLLHTATASTTHTGTADDDVQTIVTNFAAPTGTDHVKAQWGLSGGTGGTATVARSVVSDTVGHYSWVLYGLRPQTQHAVQVAAKIDGLGVSNLSDAVEVEWTPKGIWLTETAQDLWVDILGVQDVPQTLSRDGGTFYLINRPDPVRIEAKPRGFFGTVSGTVLGDEPASGFARTAEEKIAILEKIVGKYSKAPSLQLAFGVDSFPVVIADYQKRQWPVADNEPSVYDVQFSWWQTGQFTVPGAA